MGGKREEGEEKWKNLSVKDVENVVQTFYH